MALSVCQPSISLLDSNVDPGMYCLLSIAALRDTYSASRVNRACHSKFGPSKFGPPDQFYRSKFGPPDTFS